MHPSRRQFCGILAGLAAASRFARADGEKEAFALNYICASALYGNLPLEQIVPEVPKTGAKSIDIWCLPHGSQREQIDTLGLDKSIELFKANHVQVGALTRYGLGPFGLDAECAIAKRLGATLMITGSGPVNKTPGETALKDAVKAFLEKMKPHLDIAGENGVRIAAENHSGNLLNSPESILYFAELNRSPQLGVAFAPHHLHQHVEKLPQLIEALGSQILLFYAQEFGEGAKKKVEKEIELKQLPGLGTLDYGPIIQSLKKIKYTGVVEIFMHPTPRGVPILPTAPEITAVINKSRAYLDSKI